MHGGRRLGSRLYTLGAEAVVGRNRERRRLRALLGPGVGPAVVFVRGPGGIGKSVLVAGTVAELGEPVVMLDGRQVEPTPSGFLTALGGELGCPGPMRSTVQAAAALQARNVAVLVVDGFERLNLLDGWLRNEFLVALPAGVTTVLVGRRPPNLAWRTAAAWRNLLAELVLGPLSEADARLLVDRRGLSADLSQRVLHFARGHPLALDLAAEAFARHPDLHLPEGPPAEVVEELFEVLLDDLAPTERETVERASVLRRVTQPLLAAVLADEDADTTRVDLQAAWRTLRDLPFTVMTRSGLEFEAVARATLAGGLEIRDPARVQELRRRAAVVALRDAGHGRSWEATADLLYLVQNPVIRDSYVPPNDQQHPVEVALNEDLPAVLAITELHDGPAAADVIEAWWRAHQDGFVVSRGPDGAVTAFSVVVRLGEVDRQLADIDPVLAAFLADVHDRPLPAGGEALLHRRALGLRRGEHPSPEVGAMVVDIKRLYLELRPVLSRVLAVTADWPTIGPAMRAMGFSRVRPSIPLGEVSYHACALDFGPRSVDGWLLRHVLVESGTTAGEDPAPTTTSPAEGPVPRAGDGRPLPVARLSAREREVLAVLAEGATNNELAERLFISERTVNRHLSNIFTKLEVANRTAAARIAIQAGLAG
jgi:DNA-binding CsgD family transcriptional regulator